MAREFDKSFCYETFGKRWCELSATERKEFYRLCKIKSRQNPEIAEREKEYQKEYRKKNADKIYKIQKKYRKKNKTKLLEYYRARNKKLGMKPRNTSLVHILFGKSVKELSILERRKYVRLISYLNRYNISKEDWLKEHSSELLDFKH